MKERNKRWYVLTRVKQTAKHFLAKHRSLYKILYFSFSLLTDFNGREHWARRRSSGTVYYVIRPRTNCIEGLLALYIFVMKKMDYALNKGYVPVVDMKNYKTQYSNGKDNVWEWFFEQPNGISLDEIYRSSNPLLLSGYKWKSGENTDLFSQEVFVNEELTMKCHRLMFDNMQFNKRILDSVREEEKKIPTDECIGVYLRGTDYVKLKPVGENVQPTVEMVIEKIHEFKKKHGNPPIYLVTEDNDIYMKIKKEFPDDLYLVSYDTFVSNYNGRDFLSKSGVFKKDMRTVGEEYLVKMILLSKCRYLVSSITCGSRVSYVLNGNKYIDRYVFDLGKYK